VRKRKRRNRKRRLKLRPKHRGSRKVSHQVRDMVLERDGYCCQHCGTTRNLTLHHVKYRRYGGTSTPDNLTTLCRDCHDAVHRQWG